VCLNGRFPGEPGLAASPLVFFHHVLWKTIFGDEHYTGFYRPDTRSCHPAINVKALKATQSTDPSLWPVLILSTSITGLLMEGRLPPLCRLFNADTAIN